jgi:glutathione-specific gamma-glutamylcyclotransferase
VPLLFAYGSFLSLLPEIARDVRPERARLGGYKAAFAACSRTDWGTRANPAPVLALVPGGSCRGMTLELAPDALAEGLCRWAELEGADLALEATAEVGLPFRRDPTPVTFRTVDPAGPAVFRPLPSDRLARLVVVARGRLGTGLDYLTQLNEAMREWGLEEPVVTALWKEVEKERGEAWR